MIVLTNIRWQVPKVHRYQSKQQLEIKLTHAKFVLLRMQAITGAKLYDHAMNES